MNLLAAMKKPSLKKKLIGIIILLLISWYTVPKIMNGKQQQEQYQTAQAEKGTLVISVTASGQVSAINSASVTTEASGVISSVYIKDGDSVKSGDKIAEIDLDLEGKQRTNQALATYQSAKNTFDAANVKLWTLQAEMFDKWDTFKELAEGDTYKDVISANRNLPEFHIPQKEWFAAEATYKNQQAVIGQARTALSSSWLSYQQASNVIYAPIAGTITGLSLQKGSVITTQRTSTSNTATTQKVASIKTDAPPTITINLTEIDVPQVKVGQKATVKFDALTDKTFTGLVVSVDTIGTVSSGVTTYPTVIRLDTQTPEILPNMAAAANIMTQTKDNALLIPSSAVQTQNGKSSVRIMQNGKVKEVLVETGFSSDTQAEIISGIKEGDTLVIGTAESTGQNQQQSGQTQSPFSPFGSGGRGGGFGSGGGFIRR